MAKMPEYFYFRIKAGSTKVEIEDASDTDVVEVVRCNVCKHYQGVHNCEGHAPCDFWGIGGVMANDFCSRGERRDDVRTV